MTISTPSLRRFLLIPAFALVVTACGSAGTSLQATPPTAAGTTVAPTQPTTDSPAPSPTNTPAASDAGVTEPPGGTTSGDVPDNAVFLTYKYASPGFSVQYVEGWQVTPQADGVVIRDKDSSETVRVVAAQSDVAGYVASTDLPALQAQPGFSLIKQDTVKVGGATYIHLNFHQMSPPDSVTGKQVPQTADRYYVPGSRGLAIVSLATPDGVDNVDAFRQMIESFTWS